MFVYFAFALSMNIEFLSCSRINRTDVKSDKEEVEGDWNWVGNKFSIRMENVEKSLLFDKNFPLMEMLQKMLSA